MARRFTLMYIPDSGKRTRRYLVTHRLIISALAVASVCVLVLGYICVDYYRLQLDQQQFTRLLIENSEQRQQLSHLTRSFGELQRDVVVMAGAEARVRESLGPDASVPKAVPVGIGGALETSATDMTALQKQINDLRLAIDLRRESQEEVRDLLNDKHSLASATPEGWPTKGWLTSYFGMRESPYSGEPKMHEGLDIGANIGTSVTATADGVVVKATTEPGFGKVVMIDHGYGYRTIFGHNSKLMVTPGMRVKRGDKISEVGNTGRSTGPHLHYEVRLNGVPIDPRKFL
ncbi:M23 family metallopeptidase [Geopsychrobacter electrodiphilus]|uniref:M23 family metallopeptidase n=1 Tax=Geopsychrobacter electrodiphilus TaxID=225196 RepID=UPI0003A55361|nr:M23 family metallopeptidase [Geopsychrobacter electrodiphilus]